MSIVQIRKRRKHRSVDSKKRSTNRRKHSPRHHKKSKDKDSDSVRKLNKSGDLLKFMETISDEYDKVNELNEKLTKLVHSDKDIELKHFLINEINFYNDQCIKQITENFNNKCREGIFIPIVSEAEWTEITTRKWTMYFSYLINLVSGLATSDFISIVTSILDILGSVKFGDLSQKFHKTTFISICLENEHNEDTVTMLFFALRIKRRTKKKSLFFFDLQSDMFTISLCLFMAHSKKNIKEIKEIERNALTISEDLSMFRHKSTLIESESFSITDVSVADNSLDSSDSSINSDSFFD